MKPEEIDKLIADPPPNTVFLTDADLSTPDNQRPDLAAIQRRWKDRPAADQNDVWSLLAEVERLAREQSHAWGILYEREGILPEADEAGGEG